MTYRHALHVRKQSVSQSKSTRTKQKRQICTRKLTLSHTRTNTEMSSALPQHKRNEIVSLLSSGKLSVLVCSDAMARGIDVPGMCLLLQCVAVCCSVLQCVAVCCSVLQCYSAVQCVAVCSYAMASSFDVQVHLSAYWRDMTHSYV